MEQSRLDWPDNHHFEAATGWLMLGNAREARMEFEFITPDSRQRLQVLDLEWQLLAAEKRWKDAAAVADTQVLRSPQDVAAWIHRSFALHELRLTQEARDMLLPADAMFPQDTTIPYNLACYECQLGNLPAARDWLRRAVRRHKSGEARQEHLTMALDDPDLRPLAAEIQRGDFGDDGE